MRWKLLFGRSFIVRDAFGFVTPSSHVRDAASQSHLRLLLAALGGSLRKIRSDGGTYGVVDRLESRWDR